MKPYVKFSAYELVFQRFPINLISENPLKLMFGTKNMRNHRGYLILFSSYLKNSHTHEFFGRPVLSYQKNDLFWIFGDLKSKSYPLSYLWGFILDFESPRNLKWISPGMKVVKFSILNLGKIPNKSSPMWKRISFGF
jgi:hypothetical protein